jgi:hypothetical protein
MATSAPMHLGLTKPITEKENLVASSRASPETVSVTRNLVDPASSHMLVSRTKPCKSQSKWITVGLQTAH